MRMVSISSVKSAVRPPLASVLWPLARPFRGHIERTRDGSRLRPGITAVIAARDEAYAIRFCLQSLIGFVDQIVCAIDTGTRGSQDDTLLAVEEFRERWGGAVGVDVIAMPGALLRDRRDEGLRRSRHEWHLRWDADMVAKTSGPESILPLRERALASDRPRAISFGRTNLYGDLRHTSIFGPVVDSGEAWLTRFGRPIRYVEYRQYDDVRIPLYYAHREEPGRHCFHLAGLKTDDNLIYRFHYFAWRAALAGTSASANPGTTSLEDFARRRNEELFGTNDPRALKFRYQRQLSYQFTRYDPNIYGDYPEVLGPELGGTQRFEVLYRDGRPWSRIDRQDEEMLVYQPTEADLAWDPEEFLRRFLSAEQCRVVGIEPNSSADAA